MHGAKIQATVHVVHPTNSSERIKREKVSHLYCAYRAARRAHGACCEDCTSMGAVAEHWLSASATSNCAGSSVRIPAVAHRPELRRIGSSCASFSMIGWRWRRIWRVLNGIAQEQPMCPRHKQQTRKIAIGDVF